MKLSSPILVGFALLGLLAVGTSVSPAQDLRRDAIDEAVDKPADGELAADADVETRRDWLRARLAEGLSTERQIRSMNTKLNRMSEEQLDKLISAYQKRREKARLRKALAELAEAQALRDQLLKIKADQEALLHRNAANNAALFNNAGPFNHAGLFHHPVGPWPAWGGAGVPGWGLGSGGTVGFAPVVTWLPQGTFFQAGGLISPDGRSVRVSAFPFFSSIGPVDTFDFGGGMHHGHGHNHVHCPHDGHGGHGHHDHGHGHDEHGHHEHDAKCDMPVAK